MVRFLLGANIPLRKVPAAPSARRLPSYLGIVKQLQIEGNEYISGTLTAREMGLESIQVWKDLAITGVSGKPRLEVSRGGPYQRHGAVPGLVRTAGRSAGGGGEPGKGPLGIPGISVPRPPLCGRLWYGSPNNRRGGPRNHRPAPGGYGGGDSRREREDCGFNGPPGDRGHPGKGGNRGDLEFYQRKTKDAGSRGGPKGGPLLRLRRVQRDDKDREPGPAKSRPLPSPFPAWRR
jgi:hypothetical protein